MDVPDAWRGRTGGVVFLSSWSVMEEAPRRGGESRRRKTKRKNSGRGEPSEAGILFMMDGSSLMTASAILCVFSCSCSWQ